MRFPPTDIQLIQAPETWAAERASWRIVIQLNLVRSIRTILDTISDVRVRELPVSSASEASDDESYERARLPFHLETIAIILRRILLVSATLTITGKDPHHLDSTLALVITPKAN